MTTLFPPGYGGFPSYQFGLPNQITSRYYNDPYRRRETTFAPHYPAQPLYQPPFNPAGAYSSANYDRAGRPSFGAQLINAVNALDEQYRQEQYLRRLEKMQQQYWKPQRNAMPLPTYAAPPPPLAMNYPRGTLYEYEKETEYIPYPIYIQPGARGLGNQTTLGYGQPWNTGYGGVAPMNFGANYGAGLTPKIRVIFIPTGQSFSQQPCTGPLAMPPFLYNRISQPFCSFPLPPPLPQLGSLPLTPAVQQMVVQRYSNPIAVLPFNSNWQIPPMMMSGFPQALQQQQQPMPGYQSYLPAPQSYLPPSMPGFPSLPPAQQSYIPFPGSTCVPAQAFSSLPPVPQPYMPPFLSLPPVPQSYIPPPPPPAYMSAFPSLPPGPQSYIPPPVSAPTSSFAMMPVNQSMPQLSSSQLPSPQTNLSLSPSSEYSNSSYPSLCRACPPAPPPLSILVTGHCWVQHCSACHHVPTLDAHSNVRPSGGRFTPLLRHPTVPQYIPDQTSYQQQLQYAHVNAPVMMRPWLRKTPPLPPGGVIISDKYYNRDGSRWRSNHVPRRHRQHKRSSHGKQRSTTVGTRSMTSSSAAAAKTSRSISPRRASRTDKIPTQDQVTAKPKGVKSQTSSNSSSSGLSGEYHKTTLYPPKAKKDTIPQQLAGEARSVNLQYNYQPQELPTVYNVNRYLKSSSETSTVSFSRQTSSDRSSSLIKEGSQFSQSTNDSIPIKEESIVEKPGDGKPPLPPSHSKKVKERLIIVREFVANSPSTISTISSTTSFAIIDKDTDCISTTSTIEANKLEGDDDLRLEML